MYVLIANFINLGFNLITNFVLPKELSVESYATIKTFQLYVSYAGLFHFGFVDGMYLKYGGKNIKELRREDLGTNLSTLRMFEIVVTIACAIIAIISKQEVLVFFSLSILPLNLANYFKQLYQATGEFSLYGKIMNANTILIFFANMKYREDTLYLFCHGFYSPKERIFLKRLMEVAEGEIQYFHWGDMDMGGIRIFRFNKKNIFPKLKPYKMDREAFQEALERGAGIPLEEKKKEKLEKLNAGELEELKKCILEKGVEIEQEILLVENAIAEN